MSFQICKWGESEYHIWADRCNKLLTITFTTREAAEKFIENAMNEKLDWQEFLPKS